MTLSVKAFEEKIEHLEKELLTAKAMESEVETLKIDLTKAKDEARDLSFQIKMKNQLEAELQLEIEVAAFSSLQMLSEALLGS